MDYALNTKNSNTMLYTNAPEKIKKVKTSSNERDSDGFLSFDEEFIKDPIKYSYDGQNKTRPVAMRELPKNVKYKNEIERIIRSERKYYINEFNWNELLKKRTYRLLENRRYIVGENHKRSPIQDIVKHFAGVSYLGREAGKWDKVDISSKEHVIGRPIYTVNIEHGSCQSVDSLWWGECHKMYQAVDEEFHYGKLKHKTGKWDDSKFELTDSKPDWGVLKLHLRLIISAYTDKIIVKHKKETLNFDLKRVRNAQKNAPQLLKDLQIVWEELLEIRKTVNDGNRYKELCFKWQTCWYQYMCYISIIFAVAELLNPTHCLILDEAYKKWDMVLREERPDLCDVIKKMINEAREQSILENTELIKKPSITLIGENHRENIQRRLRYNDNEFDPRQDYRFVKRIDNKLFGNIKLLSDRYKKYSF